ncbi:CAP domain-containing protein [Streptomyces griseiscabiei]|uniref:CAP domain-containing protein n=1 Tax=Streptomyces griseiscabiei TaxID=2993540 RepID=A0ABU4LB23_9ACTN|nr:CAP domain-containing protein [Streptomyces griseiscabiei]MBZ3904048.1 CAP domain-containing protein [Streptomyces griseiscabiei]MDX2912974.1 CAP domain-containing protein [Streptomyces griseiscabiei]
MGRHRRSAAGRAARGGRAAGVTDTGFATEEPHYGPENLYGFAAFLEADAAQSASRGGGSRRRKKRTVTPVKTGLLGVSAAVALGTVAVATGVLPGGDKYAVSGGSSNETVVPAGSPTGAATQQGGTDGAAQEQREDESTSRDAEREASPSNTPSPSEKPAEKPSDKAGKGSGSQKTEKPSEKPTEDKEKEKTTPPVEVSVETQAEAAVLLLVNEERAKAGCSPVAANSDLAKLAETFSADMALRGFFDHTTPDGDDPWDRAAALGITGLGGENIARGQATAEAVMEAWMNSPGHKANILNCDFKTLGVGVHLGDGGPWWTQDFGY